MTPKPDNLPAPADMDLATLLREMARVLHNAGGEAYGAGYSAKLADAAIARADDLPGWKPIETAPRDGVFFLYRPKASDIMGQFIVRDIRDTGVYAPSHWYDFGGGSPMPPAPDGGE
jgi:hypothetical protein